MGNKLNTDRKFTLLENPDIPAVTCMKCLKVCADEKILSIHSLMHNNMSDTTYWRGKPDPSIEVYWLFSNIAGTVYYFMDGDHSKQVEVAFQSGAESIDITVRKHKIHVDFVRGEQVGTINTRRIQRVTREEVLSHVG